MFTLKNIQKSLKILFILIWFIKALESLYLFSHGDALSYHLVWPKILAESGFQGLLNDFFPFWLTGYFDLIYIIPFKISGVSSWTQSLGQLFHFFFSIGLASILIVKSIKPKEIAYLGAIALLTLNKSSDFFLYAKNDGFVALLCLLIFYLIEGVPKVNIKRGFLITSLFALALASKLSSLFVLAPLGVYFIYKIEKKVAILPYLLLALLITCPAFILKYSYLKNPFFPAFLSSFPGDFSQEAQMIWAKFVANPPSIDKVLTNLKYFFLSKVLFILFIPFLLIRKPNHHILTPLVISLTSIGLYLVVNGGVTSARFYFGAIFLFSLAFIRMTRLIYGKTSKKSAFLITLLLFSLIDSKLDKSLNRIKHFTKDHITLNEKEFVVKYIPRAEVWNVIPKNQKTTTIFTEGFSQSFYAPAHVRLKDLSHLGVLPLKETCYLYDYLIYPKNQNPECHNIEVVFEWNEFKLFKVTHI